MNFRGHRQLERIATETIARDRGTPEVVLGIAVNGKTMIDTAIDGMTSIEMRSGMILARRGRAVIEIEIETIDGERDRRKQRKTFAKYASILE